jgi:hypothetical protein
MHCAAPMTRARRQEGSRSATTPRLLILVATLLVGLFVGAPRASASDPTSWGDPTYPKLVATTTDNRFWTRDPVPYEVNWDSPGFATGDPSVRIVAMASLRNTQFPDGKLFAARSDNTLVAADPLLSFPPAWQTIGHANSVVAMAAVKNSQFPNGKLFAVTSDNNLWARDPVLSKANWQLIGPVNIGPANHVTAMAAISKNAQFPNGKLFAATSDNKLLARDPVLSNVSWQPIGHANNVVGMAAVDDTQVPQFPNGGKLFAATSDNKLWIRDPALYDIPWHHIGHANSVTTMTSEDGWYSPLN